MKVFFFCFICFFCFTGHYYAQNKSKSSSFNKKTDSDTTTKYILYKDRIVVYTDLGFISSPFFISFKDTKNINHTLTYRINHGLILGVGGSYKWFSIRLSYMIVHNLEDKKKYGKTNYFGAHLGFPFKNTFSEINLLRFGGYVLINANKKIDNYPNKRIIYPKISNLDVTISSYYFFNPDFSINPVLGRSGNYKTQTTSWYLKGSLGLNSIQHTDSTLIPVEFENMLYEKQKAERITALNLGIVPGFAYVTRYKNWQFSGVAGFGINIQNKSYVSSQVKRNFIGVAPRIDVKINIGYNPSDWFIMLNSELDYRQVSFQKLISGNPLFNIKLTGGYRFKTKSDKHNTTSTI